MEESRAVLAELFRVYPKITLVVDALDECDKETRSDFLDILDKLIRESQKPTKLFISSRRDRDIKHRFENGLNLEITATDNQDDITKFVKHKIATSRKYWQDEIGIELKELITETLINKSGGM